MTAYCVEIRTLLDAAEAIRVAASLYNGNERGAKYHIIAAANHFILPGQGKKYDLATFNKHCNPPLTEAEIAELNITVQNTISTLTHVQETYNTDTTEDAPVIVNDIEAAAFLSDHPMQRIREQYYRLHYGDDDALNTVIWSFCVKSVDIALDEGIHIIAIGERGSGKSHGITSAMEFTPPELTWIKGISARYLFYAKNLVRGMTIYLDDVPADPNLLDSLKAIITAYPNGGKRGTVLNGEPLELSIPARVTIHTSSVDQKADEQFTNRMTPIRAASNKDNKKHRVEFRLNLYEGETLPVDDHEREHIRNALRHISRKTFSVRVPKGAIVCDNADQIDIRVLNQFMDAVIGNAILNYPNRSPEDCDGKTHITITKDDFDAVIHMYQNPDEYNHKLTDAAIAIKKYLRKVSPETKSVGEISEATGIDEQVVRRSIRGRPDRHIFSLIEAGLVEEISATTQEKEIISGSSGVEYTKPVGIRLTSKVYRATRLATLSSDVVAKKKPDSMQGGLEAFVGMVRWAGSDMHMHNDSGGDDGGEFPMLPIVSQAWETNSQDVNSNIISLISHNIVEGGGQ